MLALGNPSDESPALRILRWRPMEQKINSYVVHSTKVWNKIYKIYKCKNTCMLIVFLITS